MLNLQTAALQKQKEELQRLREEEGDLLVSLFSAPCTIVFHSDI